MRVGLVLLLFLNLLGCDQADTPRAVANDDAAKAPSDQRDLIPVSDLLLARLQHQVLEPVLWSSKLKVSGTIELDERHVAHVGTTVSGRVIEIQASLGDVVQKGDVLATVHSSAIAETQLAYLKALAAYDLAKKSVARAQKLYQEGVIAAAELQRRESELLSLKAEWDAGRDKMALLGMTNQDVQKLDQHRQIQSVIAIRAPMDGVVLARKLSKGQVLEPADMAYTIAELTRVWAVGEVPERYSAQMRKGKRVEVVIPALGNQARSTTLTYVANTVNPQTRTLEVRALLDNQDERLKPDMLATMRLDSEPQLRLVVPAKAIVREDNKDWVYVKVAEGVYRLQHVVLGEAEDGARPVESGVQAGQQIVVDGVFALHADRLNRQSGK